MKKGTALVAVGALFLVGILVGVLGTHLFYFRAVRQPGGIAAVGLRAIAADLDRKLDLTEAQEREVAAVLEDARRRFALLRRRISPEILEVAKASQARVAALLDERQRAEFDSFRDRHTAWLERQLAGSP